MTTQTQQFLLAESMNWSDNSIDIHELVNYSGLTKVLNSWATVQEWLELVDQFIRCELELVDQFQFYELIWYCDGPNLNQTDNLNRSRFVMKIDVLLSERLGEKFNHDSCCSVQWRVLGKLTHPIRHSYTNQDRVDKKIVLMSMSNMNRFDMRRMTV